MKLKRWFFQILIFSQVGLLPMALTAQAASGPSPEETLLQNAITLQGRDLSQAALGSELSSAMANYVATAPEQGMQSRFQQALIDLGIYTPTQASAFAASSESAAMKLGALPASSESQAATLISTELASLVRTAQGAQFSGCSYAGGLTTFLGALLVAGGIVGTQQCKNIYATGHC